MFPGEHTFHASSSSLSDCFSDGVAILVVVDVAIIVVAVVVAMISVTVAVIAAVAIVVVVLIPTSILLVVSTVIGGTSPIIDVHRLYSLHHGLHLLKHLLLVASAAAMAFAIWVSKFGGREGA